ncbi:hypothetical protein GCM10011346_52980 [Oceanobacillus neutriphilus]|uniref:Uncharacterized protein n=1 Tax=Oceanobacillus neutriphilus TaxID=531815 RepID=A0ABQ2P3H9_9BACI|nr:hypothetical protein GCM10011346_52980 [Oceanobacillus neutriphilus]
MSVKKETSGVWLSEEELDKNLKRSFRNLYISIAAFIFALGAFVVVLLHFVKCM